jgi:hypothetical protein
LAAIDRGRADQVDRRISICCRGASESTDHADESAFAADLS